jgi:hypothetical protein
VIPPPPPRVVVAADVDAPGGAGRHRGGIEVAEQARRRWPGVGAVFIAGRRPSDLHGHVLDRPNMPPPSTTLRLASRMLGQPR